MTTYRTLKYQKTGNVLVLDLIDPGSSQEEIALLSNELTERCAETAWDEKVQVIVITGEKTFPREGNGNGVFSEVSEEQGIRFPSIAEPIAKLDQPVIAGIHGDAIGQGLELALACDIRIASDTSRFALPHIKAGLMPWDGGTQRLSRLVGRGKALEMILTGGVIDAKEACRMGLINKSVPAGELMTVVLEMAQGMASRGPLALRYAKEAVHKGTDMSLAQGLRLEADLYCILQTTADRTEGIRAYQQKKTPVFKGQ